MGLGLKLAVPLLLAAALFGGYCAGKHVASEEDRDVWLDAEANRLIVEVQIVAMLRSGDYAGAIKRSDVYIAEDLIGLDAFAQPDRPPLGRNVLSALKLASITTRNIGVNSTNPSPLAGAVKTESSTRFPLGQQTVNFVTNGLLINT